MALKGSWRNQYGSQLEITDESNGRIAGWFRSKVDGRIKGHEIAIVGVHQENLISFVLNGSPYTKFVVSWTGMLREGRIETLFTLVASERLTAEAEGAPARNQQLGPWEATTVGADVFERIS
ncbi:avidin/streptavidin family protein [Ktedonosporobacter rubrisoli]|nr:avidin/streptavidin family protein [Ktedonosporobacter rubrisoli]